MIQLSSALVVGVVNKGFHREVLSVEFEIRVAILSMHSVERSCSREAESLFFGYLYLVYSTICILGMEF